MKPKMKIALVSQEYPPETARGGIGSQTYAKAKWFSEQGHRVFVISRSLDSERSEKSEGNITVIRSPGMEDKLPDMTDIVQWITHSMVVAAEIESLHKKAGLDIIDFPEWAAEGYCHLLNRTDWNRIPVVIQLHGPLVMLGHAIGWPEMDSQFYKMGTLMEATCVQLADAVYSSSACSTEWIHSYYNPEKENIPTIHVGVDIKVFSPKAVFKDARPTLIFVGKIVRNKGVEELVRAAANLVKDFPDLQLRLIGKGDEKYIHFLKDIADGLGANSLLNLPGFIDKEDLPEELSKAHIFCAPSYYEGGPGFVYLEAMACGLPVIGCSGSGAEEIIQSGENGILVPPGDTEALENALKKILSDKKVLEDMGANARNYVLKEAESNACLKKLEDFYYSVLSSELVKAGT